MRFVSLLFLCLLFLNCDTQKHAFKQTRPDRFVKFIKGKELKSNLYQLASDAFEGRETGQNGQKKAAEFLKEFYRKNKIAPALEEGYFQEVPGSYFDHKFKDTENVAAFIKGAEKPEEIVVISAHYDHLGIKDGKIYYGADDDASGTVAVMQTAKAFKRAAKRGFYPRRSVLFLHLTGEEKGLLGSRYYVENPIFPLAQTVANLNTDMVGRVDQAHQGEPDYLYLIGSNRLSTELDSIIQQQNKKYTALQLDYTYNAEDDPNRFYYRSDHYNFAKHKIPVVFFFNGVHEDYHKPTDTPDKINYELLKKRTELLFYTAWEVANRESRLVVDVEQDVIP